jgi:hypothetical protein
MVHLYCAERGFMPDRPTKDADAVLDVRVHPDIVDRFTSALIEMRWTKDRSQIDVLIPTTVRRTAASRRGRARRQDPNCERA